MTPRDGQPDGAGGGLAYANLRAIEWLGMHLPRPVGLFLADVYFRYYFARAHRQRAVVARNMAQVLGHHLGPPCDHETATPVYRLWHKVRIRRAGGTEEVEVDGAPVADPSRSPRLATWLSIRPLPGRTTRVRDLDLSW